VSLNVLERYSWQPQVSLSELWFIDLECPCGQRDWSIQRHAPAYVRLQHSVRQPCRHQRAGQHPALVCQQPSISLSRRHDEAGESQLVCVHDHPRRRSLHLSGVLDLKLATAVAFSDLPRPTKSAVKETDEVHSSSFSSLWRLRLFIRRKLPHKTHVLYQFSWHHLVSIQADVLSPYCGTEM